MQLTHQLKDDLAANEKSEQEMWFSSSTAEPGWVFRRCNLYYAEKSVFDNVRVYFWTVPSEMVFHFAPPPT